VGVGLVERVGTSLPKKLERLLDELIETRVFHTRREIAEECGITDQGLSQVLSDPQRRLSVEQCLRLARKIRANPVAILRVAGRTEAATVLEDLWPRDRDLVAITRSEREVIDQWRTMTISDRHHLGALMKICADRERARTDGRGGPARDATRAWPRPKPKKVVR
jgi:hypothetical protein